MRSHTITSALQYHSPPSRIAATHSYGHARSRKARAAATDARTQTRAARAPQLQRLAASYDRAKEEGNLAARARRVSMPFAPTHPLRLDFSRDHRPRYLLTAPIPLPPPSGRLRYRNKTAKAPLCASESPSACIAPAIPSLWTAVEVWVTCHVVAGGATRPPSIRRRARSPRRILARAARRRGGVAPPSPRPTEREIKPPRTARVSRASGSN